MDIEGNIVHLAKRIANLDVQCEKLKKEKIKLKEELMKEKGKQEKMIEKCAKEKDKYMKVMEEFSSEKSKWREKEKNIEEICRQVGVEKRKLEIDLKASKRRMTNVIMEAAQKLMDKDRHFKGLLEESNGTVTTLLANNEALNTRNRRLEMDFEAQMAKVKEEFDSKGRKWREEEEKIREECRQLDIEKRKLDIDLKAAKRRIADGGGDVAEKLKAVEAEAEGLRILLEEKDRKITALLANNGTFEGQNRRLTRNQKLMEKSLELTRKIEVLEGWKEQMEAEYCKLKEDNRNEAEKFFNVKKAFEDEKKELEKAKQKINELVKWIGVLERDKEAEKMAMEEEGKKMVSELTCRIELLEREIEAEACREKQATSEEIVRILKAVVSRSARGSDELAKKLKMVEAESEALTSFFEEKLLVLRQKIHVMEGEKARLEAEFRKMKEDNKNEAEKIHYLNKELETEKKRRERERKKINELVERVKEKEAEKGAMEDEGKKKVSELTSRIEVLETEINRMLDEKKIAEAREMAVGPDRKKMDSEFVKRIEMLEREIKKLLNENTALKEKHTKEIMNLVSKYAVLEREKQRLEVEARVKFERMNVTVQDKEHPMTMKKKMAIGMKRCVVKSNNSASNIGVLSTPTTENQGSEIQKGKRDGPGCSEVNQARAKRCKTQGRRG